MGELDEDHSGTITLDELLRVLDDPIIRARFTLLELDPSSATDLFKLLDTDESGSVSVDEFIMTCIRLKGSAKSVDQATMFLEQKRLHRLLRTSIRCLREDLVEVRELIEQKGAQVNCRRQSIGLTT